MRPVSLARYDAQTVFKDNGHLDLGKTTQKNLAAAKQLITDIATHRPSPESGQRPWLARALANPFVAIKHVSDVGVQAVLFGLTGNARIKKGVPVGTTEPTKLDATDRIALELREFALHELDERPKLGFFGFRVIEPFIKASGYSRAEVNDANERISDQQDFTTRLSDWAFDHRAVGGKKNTVFKMGPAQRDQAAYTLGATRADVDRVLDFLSEEGKRVRADPGVMRRVHT